MKIFKKLDVKTLRIILLCVYIWYIYIYNIIVYSSVHQYTVKQLNFLRNLGIPRMQEYFSVHSFHAIHH